MAYAETGFLLERKYISCCIYVYLHSDLPIKQMIVLIAVISHYRVIFYVEFYTMVI